MAVCTSSPVIVELLAFKFPLPQNLCCFTDKRYHYCDVIFSKLAECSDVHPHFFDGPDSLLQQNEEKLRGPKSHTETPPADGLHC